MRTHSKHSIVLRHQIVGLLSFFIFLFAFSTLALGNPNWNNFGNQGQVYDGLFLSDTIFGSNLPANTNEVEFNPITVTDGNNYSPLIADYNFDGTNEIMTFFSSSVRLYNNEGMMLSTLSLNGTLCGNGVVMEYFKDFPYPLYEYRQIGIMTSNASGYIFYVIGAPNNALEIVKSDYVASTQFGSGIQSSCEVHYIEPSEALYAVNTNGSILKYSYYNSSFSNIPLTNPFGAMNLIPSSAPYFHGGSSCSIQYNGYSYIYYTGGSSGNIKIIRFNANDNSFINTTGSSLSYSASIENVITCGNIGSLNSEPEIFISQLSTSNAVYNSIYGFDLSLKITRYITGTGLGKYQKVFYTVADMNKDGNNEYCARYGIHNITCYDYANTKIMDTYFSSDTFIDGIISLADYDKSDSYMQILTSTGLYKMNNNANATEIFNLTGGIGMSLPVAVRNYVDAEKDILKVNNLSMILYINANVTVVCGDGVCEFPENPFVCDLDCGQPINDADTGTVVNGNLCKNDSWCISGTCNVLTGMCQGKAGGVYCTADAQCGTGVCDNNNLCTKEYVTDKFNQALIEMGFGNVAGLALVGLIIIFLCVLIGAKWAGITGALGGLGFGVVLSVLVLSLLNIWFLFFFFLLLVGMGVLMFLFKKSE